MSTFLDRILEDVTTKFYNDSKNKGVSLKDYREIVLTPLCSRVLTKLGYQILNSGIFQDAYGFSKEQINCVYLEEPNHGFAGLEYSTLNHSNDGDKKSYCFPLSHIYNQEDFYFYEEEEDALPFYDVKRDTFIQKEVSFSQEELDFLAKLNCLETPDSWIYQALHWNDNSLKTILGNAELKIIEKNSFEIAEELQEVHGAIGNLMMREVMDLKYLGFDGSYFRTKEKPKDVFGYLDSPIGVLSYVSFKTQESGEYDYYLSSTGTCYGFRKLGLAEKVIQFTLDNAFTEKQLIIRSSPGVHTPDKFTQRLTSIFNTAKPLIMPSYLNNLPHTLLFELKNRKQKLQKEDYKKLLRQIRDFIVSKETDKNYENQDLLWKNTDDVSKIIDNYIKKKIKNKITP